MFDTISLSIKIAQKPYIIGSLGPKALKYEFLEGKGMWATSPLIHTPLSGDPIGRHEDWWAMQGVRLRLTLPKLYKLQPYSGPPSS